MSMTDLANKEKDAVSISTVGMWLVYVSDDGKRFFQHWGDVVACGGLIDPETGDDMELIGWTTRIAE